jgi:hypothetical protein
MEKRAEFWQVERPAAVAVVPEMATASVAAEVLPASRFLAYP